MTSRSEMLAERFEHAIAEFIDTIEALPESQWRTMCPNEKRSIAVLTRHVAAAIPFEMTVFREIAEGHQPPPITGAELDEMNAQDAEEWANCSRVETLTLLHANAAAAAKEVRQLSEAQLERSGTFIAELPTRSVEGWLDHILIGHVHGHLNSIRKVITSDRTGQAITRRRSREGTHDE